MQVKHTMVTWRSIRRSRRVQGLSLCVGRNRGTGSSIIRLGENCLFGKRRKSGDEIKGLSLGELSGFIYLSSGSVYSAFL